MTSLEPLLVHDRRCERANTSAYRLTCRCADRAAMRKLTLECGTASSMSAEVQANSIINVNDLVAERLRRMTASLAGRVRNAGRVPLLSTMHLIGEYDQGLECDTMRLVVLTVPEGTPLTESLAEVADDWMRARGLRR